MKLTKKNTKSLVAVTVLTMIAGTVFWAVIEKILELEGISLSLSTGRMGFDLDVISVYIKLNPGTAGGIGLGFLLFKRL